MGGKGHAHSERGLYLCRQPTLPHLCGAGALARVLTAAENPCGVSWPCNCHNSGVSGSQTGSILWDMLAKSKARSGSGSGPRSTAAGEGARPTQSTYDPGTVERQIPVSAAASALSEGRSGSVCHVLL